MEWYLLAINVPNDQSARKVAILVTVAGADAQDVFNTFTYAPAVGNVPAESPDHYDIVLRKFEPYSVPRKNTVYESYTFNTREQEEGETIDSFLTALRLKAATCEFGTLLDSMIRDHHLKEKMLRDPGLTQDTAITICRAAETAQRQIKVLTSVDSETVNYVNRFKQQNID